MLECVPQRYGEDLMDSDIINDFVRLHLEGTLCAEHTRGSSGGAKHPPRVRKAKNSLQSRNL